LPRRSRCGEGGFTRSRRRPLGYGGPAIDYQYVFQKVNDQPETPVTLNALSNDESAAGGVQTGNWKQTTFVNHCSAMM
jgi:hypothetical protein